MSPGPRDYKSTTRIALGVCSGGRCYFPGCDAPVVRFVGDPARGIIDEPSISTQIAHIHDAVEGNRYQPDMSDDDRRSFENLILLCKAHHDLVDKKHPDRYRAADLRSWKLRREASVRSSTAGGSTDDLLRTIAVEQNERYLDELAGEAGNSLASLVASFGRVVRHMPSGDEQSARELVRLIAKCEWSRDEELWPVVQESFLFRLKFVVHALKRMEELLHAALASISQLKSTADFQCTPSLQCFMQERSLQHAFVDQVREAYVETILDRIVAATLLPMAVRGRQVRLAWQAESSPCGLADQWAVPLGAVRQGASITFEIFTSPPGFSFRAHVPTSTIDLFNAESGFAVPTRLDLELVDAYAWWLVLVPEAVSRLAHDAEVLNSRERPYVNLLDLLSLLDRPANFFVGLP